MKLGIILTGGQSIRFGSNKAYAELNGKSLLDHSLYTMEKAADSVIIMGENTQTTIPTLEDNPIWGKGPGAGLLTALDHAIKQPKFTSLLVMPVDMPLITAEDLAMLPLNSVAEGPDGLHPTIAHYDLQKWHQIRNNMIHIKKPVALKVIASHMKAEPTRLPKDHLVNVNTLADLEKVKAHGKS